MRWAVRHTDGCNGVAFYVEQDEKPAVGDLFTEKNCVFADGTKPVAHEVVRCGSCGEPFRGYPHIGQLEKA